MKLSKIEGWFKENGGFGGGQYYWTNTKLKKQVCLQMRIKQNLYLKKKKRKKVWKKRIHPLISLKSVILPAKKRCHCERYVMTLVIFLAIGCISLENQSQAKSSLLCYLNSRPEAAVAEERTLPTHSWTPTLNFLMMPLQIAQVVGIFTSLLLSPLSHARVPRTIKYMSF